MNNLLTHSEEQLEAHFAELASLRTGGAVFALEHGVAPAQWDEIARALRGALHQFGLDERLWLLWVVYAAEHGYHFDGEEFWQSFEADTPSWRQNGSRDQVRLWFRRFRKRYGGIEPKGAWANHFSIICWPITHAILPRDLQFQFARALYQVRHSMVSAGTIDPKALGRLVRREAWHTSSRFQQFLQQEELVGRLVLAILGTEAAEGGKIILPATLARIVTDLEKTRQAKQWLESARRTVTRFKGAAPVGSRETSTRLPSPPTKPRLPSIRPTLILRRSGARRWDVGVEVPTLADHARVMEGLRHFLLTTRSTIQGGDGIWTPSSWLLGSGRERSLRQWPQVGQPILHFEQPEPALDNLLRDEGALTSGPLWVCRVRDDGTATEVLGRQVRPGRRYVLLHDGSAPMDSAMITPCETSCTGVAGGLLTIPQTVSPADEAFLAKHQMALCRTVLIWPAGLAARKWDGEGSGEWLTTESPCFAIRHDHALSQLSASLNGGEEISFRAGPPGQTTFITLPALPPGEHFLKVRAAGTGVQQQQIEGLVVVTVREPAAWVPGSTIHGGMAVVTEPGTADLDDLLNDRLAITIQGPQDRQVEVTLKSLMPASGAPLVRRQVKLPTSLTRWMQMLGEQGGEELALSSRAELAIRGDELGLYRIELEREASPLRWAVKRNASTLLRLIDESGADNPPTTTHASFSSPLAFGAVAVDELRDGITLEPPGGLYWVQGGECSEAIVVSVPPAGAQHGFRALGITPGVRSDLPMPRFSDVLSASILWRNARAVGALGSTRKAQVVQFVDDFAVSRLCGSEWMSAEAAFRSVPVTENSLSKLGERLGNSHNVKGFSAVLRKATPDIAVAGLEDHSWWFAGVAYRYKICTDPALARMAFEVATDPLHAFGKRGDLIEKDVESLAGLTVLLRGARLAAFSLNRQAQS